MTRNALPAVDQAERYRVGATIRQIRELRGFKPDQFANEVGISRPYLMNIEAGRKPLTEILLARFAKVLKVEQIVICRDGYFDPAVYEVAS